KDGGLSGSIGSQQTDHFTSPDVETDPFHDRSPSEALGQPDRDQPFIRERRGRDLPVAGFFRAYRVAGLHQRTAPPSFSIITRDPPSTTLRSSARYIVIRRSEEHTSEL